MTPRPSRTALDAALSVLRLHLDECNLAITNREVDIHAHPNAPWVAQAKERLAEDERHAASLAEVIAWMERQRDG